MASNLGSVVDPLLTFRFAVEIEGIIHAEFDECSGLQAQTDVFEYKEGGLNGYTHKLPGRTSYSNITLKWGQAGSTALWDWYSRVVSQRDKSTELHNVSIIQYDQGHTEVHRWNLAGAFPVKWVAPGFNAANSTAGVETLELAFADLTFEKR